MKILSPLAVNHEIVIIPRKYISSDVVLILKNEENDEILTHNMNPLTIEGYMYIPFTQSFLNNSNYQIKIFELRSNEIIYRGKLFITDQSNETQEYKITKDIFTF
jgi:uncharacterized protein YqkB